MLEEPQPGETGTSFPRRRRRWLMQDKEVIVQESLAPGVSVSSVVRRYGIGPNLLFTWRRVYADIARRRSNNGDAPVPRSKYRALERQVRELE